MRARSTRGPCVSRITMGSHDTIGPMACSETGCGHVEEAPMTDKQRISYVPVDQMDDEMRAEMERCAREGTPRPESSAVRAHVPACFWFFARSWNDIFRHGVCDHQLKELCRVYISRTVQCEYCGNQRSVAAAATGLIAGKYDEL